MRTTVQAGADWLWLEDSGGPGEPAVLLHPGIADSRYWDLVWPDLAGPLRLIRYDARGYGSSGPPTQPYRQLDDLRRVLDHCGVASAHLVGCSMGGATAIDLALADPGRVRTLTLLCPGVSGYPWPAEPEFDAESEAAAAAGEDAVVALALREWAAAGSDALVTDMMRSAARAWSAEESFAQDPEPAFERLHELQVPAVLLVGDLDRASLIECDLTIASRIPGCELIRLPGVDHLPAIRDPGLVARTVLRQVERVDAGAEGTATPRPGPALGQPTGAAAVGGAAVTGQAGWAGHGAPLPGLAAFGAGLLAGAAIVAFRSAGRRRRASGGPADAPHDAAADGPGPADGGQAADGLRARIGQPGVTLADGPPGAVEAALTELASDLAATPLPGPLILVGFGGDVPAAGERPARAAEVVRHGALAAALDQVAARAVALRRRLGDVGGAGLAELRASRPGEAGLGLTVLVSRVAPAPAELTLLADLAAEPGGLTAVLPAPAGGPLPAAVTVARLDGGPAARPAPVNPPLAERPVSERPTLRIGVLGPVTINGQPAGLLPAQSQLIVALALAADGLSNRRLCELLGPDPGRSRPSDSLRQLIVRTRRQLGKADGRREWIEHAGHGRYQLHPAARLDWSEFEDLAARGMRERDAGLLTKALGMVRGEPFAGCWYWWLDLALVERIRARVVTAARTLADLELTGQRPAAAARAARAGLAADAGQEQLWRLLMRAEHAAGDRAGVREAWSRCLTAVAEVAADHRPEPATAALFRELMDR